MKIDVKKEEPTNKMLYQNLINGEIMKLRLLKFLTVN